MYKRCTNHFKVMSLSELAQTIVYRLRMSYFTYYRLEWGHRL